MERFSDKVSYQTFLLSINSLLKDGKLINENGYYSIEQEAYDELHAEYKSQMKKISTKLTPRAPKDFKKKSTGRLSAAEPKSAKLMGNIRTYAINGNSGATNTAKKNLLD